MSSITVCLVQSDIAWENVDENLRQFEYKIAQQNRPKTIYFLPEMFNTGFSMQPEKLAERMNGKTVHWMKTIAQQYKIILCGSCIIEENNKYFNRLLWVLPDGKIAHYDKRHLFGYAQEDKHYTAGERKLMVRVNHWNIQLNVCYDLRFPVWARQSNDESLRYDLLVFVASWPQKRMHAWRQLLIARAIENQAYVIGVNRVGKDGNDIEYSGNSLLIDPLGAIIWELEGEEGIGTFDLQLETVQNIRNQFPFLKDGDIFTLI